VVIGAPLERCEALLLEPERLPEWYETLDAVKVLERDAEGRPSVVEIVVELPRGSVRFDLEQRYEGPGRIVGRQVGGDGKIVDVATEWRLEALEDGATRATYRFAARARSRLLRVALRAPATRRLVENDLIRGFPEALRREAEMDE
jgi:hypothetical protein